MIKKKAKSKTAWKKSGKKKSSTKKTREPNPVEVRKEISKMVASEATEMADAVIGEGKKGQLATVKYLFEMANIFPPAPDGEQATQEEDCLAKILLDKLNAPRKAAGGAAEGDAESSEGEAEKVCVDAVKDAAESDSESDEGGSEIGSE